MFSFRRAIKYLFWNPLRFIDSSVKRIGFLFPDKFYLSLRYRCLMGTWIDWKNPKTFTEKIQWLKIYGFKSEYTQMVDKLAVKDIVATVVGKQYIIPTLEVWNSVEEINWNKLPNQFVLKTTHGGGGTGVVVCTDKSKFNISTAKAQLAQSMAGIVGKEYREHPYYNVPRKIFAEQYLMSSVSAGYDSGKELSDYKFYCFNGEPKFCQVIRDRNTNETIDFYDMDWNHMPFVGLNPAATNGVNPVEKPENISNIIDICRKISRDIPFARVDLYIVKNKVYFGEVTFYPAGGFGVFTPKIWNDTLGDLLIL